MRYINQTLSGLAMDRTPPLYPYTEVSERGMSGGGKECEGEERVAGVRGRECKREEG